MGTVILLIALLLVIGLAYPVCGVILYKLSGSKKKIADILAEL